MSNELDELDALFDEIAAQTASEHKDEPTESEVSAESAELVVSEQEPMQQNAPRVGEALEATTEGARVCDCGMDAMMYDRLGPIVRQLHDALRELGYDRSLSNVVQEVSESQDRLQYIAQLTEQAANKVLNLVDEALPEQELHIDRAKTLRERWDQMYAGELSIEEFKQLAADSRSYMQASAEAAEREKARLLDIMMAQDFQDISGQIIKKVVTLTQNLERELAQLLRDYAPGQSGQNREKVVDLLSGPDAPSKALAQDDVDQMLAELGF